MARYVRQHEAMVEISTPIVCVFPPGDTKDMLGDIHTVKEKGISIIHQELSLVPEMTVAENVFLGRMLVGKFGFVDDKTPLMETRALLNKFGLSAIDPAQRVKELSVAQQQMVEIMRALSTDARIIVMDEPTASLTDQEIETLFTFIDDLKKRDHAELYKIVLVLGQGFLPAANQARPIGRTNV